MSFYQLWMAGTATNNNQAVDTTIIQDGPWQQHLRLYTWSISSGANGGFVLSAETKAGEVYGMSGPACDTLLPINQGTTLFIDYDPARTRLIGSVGDFTIVESSQPISPPASVPQPPSAPASIVVTFDQTVNRLYVPISFATPCSTIFGTGANIGNQDVVVVTHSGATCNYVDSASLWVQDQTVNIGESFTVILTTTPITAFTVTAPFLSIAAGAVTFDQTVNRLYVPISFATPCSAIFGTGASIGNQDVVVVTHSGATCNYVDSASLWVQDQTVNIGESFTVILTSTLITAFSVSHTGL